MAKISDDKWEDCRGNQIRFLAEFTWEGGETPDKEAEDQFKNYPRFFSKVDLGQTQGYYLTGARTFVVISCASTEAEIKDFCDKVKGKTAIAYKYYYARRV